MPDERQNRDTELILPPGVYAYLLDQTKGKVNTLCGPIKTSLSNTDQLVTYNAVTKRFVPANQAQAIQTNVIAPKGHYVIVENPSKGNRQPDSGKLEDMSSDILKMGQIENIPGPISFPLWPGQVATVVEGHHLRSNQYLLVRVYDDEAAKVNWDKSVVKGVSQETKTDDSDKTETEESQEKKPETHSGLSINKDTLVTGQLLVIKGNEVAFYIPSTGVEVLQDEDEKYVRDAVTLERLEYSILLDENGNKEYIKGPAVVFPKPTQQFVTSKADGNKRKFRAFELQDTTGIHVKVIADYEENGRAYTAGDELWITGKEQAIYYPRTEHAIISYGNQEKYFAVAIPSGEGRYVLDRQEGDINLVGGPKMFLPNPITQVVVRRILSDNECNLYFPGNAEVLTVNRELRAESGQDYSLGNTGAPVSAAFAALDYGDVGLESLGAVRSRSMAPPTALRESSAKGFVADALNRGTKYTPPRTITINSKYEGAVRIEVYSGYAVQVVNSKGDRRVVVGPQTVLLQYDEKLERLSLSKGKPKSSDNRMDTVYLKYISNPVSDIISLKTGDLVNVDIQVKYLVRFDESQKDKWFSVDNYVQYMVDHLRSLVGNTVRSIGIQEFYQNATTILRDLVLGVKGAGGPELRGERPLHHFNENGMTVYDLELISITVKDAEVAKLLSDSRQEVLRDSIELDRQTQKLMLTKGREEANREIQTELALTIALKDKLASEEAERERAEREREVSAANKIATLKKAGEEESAKIAVATQALFRKQTEADNEVERIKAEAELERKVKLLSEEAASSKTRMESVQPGLVEALVSAANAGILEKVTPHLAALAFVNGQDLENVMQTLLKGTGAEGILANLKNLTKGHSSASK